MKRSGKWYRRNEEDVMERLGFEPTPNSGSGWIVKEDGQTDELICQLKSTESASMKVSKADLEKLEYNATVAHKVPIFAIQFIGDSVYIIVKPEYIKDVADYIETGKAPEKPEWHFTGEPLPNLENQVKIRSGKEAREAYQLSVDAKWKKEKKAK